MTGSWFDALLGSRCVLCGLPSAGLACQGCRDELRANAPACVACAIPLTAPGDAVCGPCLSRRPRWDAAHAAFAYAWPADRLIQAFKYRRHLAAGRWLAEEAASRLGADMRPRPDALVPVPMPPLRRVRRGFNQSELIAADIGQALGLPVLAGLRRCARPAPQARLDGAARRRNQRGTITARRDLPAHIALVDDVMTTGATLSECTRVARAAGAERIEAWVLARVPGRVVRT